MAICGCSESLYLIAPSWQRNEAPGFGVDMNTTSGSLAGCLLLTVTSADLRLNVSLTWPLRHAHRSGVETMTRPGSYDAIGAASPWLIPGVQLGA